MVTYLDNFESTILIFDNLFDVKYDGSEGWWAVDVKT